MSLDRNSSPARRAAAVVTYARCPLTGRVVPRPLGSSSPAWFIVHAN